MLLNINSYTHNLVSSLSLTLTHTYTHTMRLVKNENNSFDQKTCQYNNVRCVCLQNRYIVFMKLTSFSPPPSENDCNEVKYTTNSCNIALLLGNILYLLCTLRVRSF